jgi:N-acetylneuraminic acid mutarotase
MAGKYAALAVIVTWVFACGPAAAQGTAFSYQGFLTDNGIPAHGSFDLQFTLFDSSSDGTPLTAAALKDDLNITNGLFTVTLDFGAGPFTGADRWVEIGVRPGASTGGYTALLPRQPINPAPYAIFAGGVSATGITGTIPAGNIGSGSITSNMLAPGAAAANLSASGQAAVPGGAMILARSPNATNLIALGYSPVGGQLDLSWQQRATTLAPSVRSDHSAVWTGSKMIIWGGFAGSGPLNPWLSTGGLYDPANNFWSSMTVSNAPEGRTRHSTVWVGNKMIIWGGANGSLQNSGGLYDPISNTWSATALDNAPVARQNHTAVWTGSEMIVWGGNAGQGLYVNSGARFNPILNTWLPITTSNAPAGRYRHTAIWTGNEMVVWGGQSPGENYSDGGRYNPVSDTWSTISTNAAPTGRNAHTAIWTGNEMIVWGGTRLDGSTQTDFRDGSRYDPVTDSWTLLTTNGAPAERLLHTGIWTGSEMIVWGGSNPGPPWNDGGIYNPMTDSWTAISTTGAPRRQGHTGIWTGAEMLIFGGYTGETVFNDIHSYTPSRVMYLYLRP